METADKYAVEFLPTALNDMAGIISSFVMLGSKQGAIRIKDKMNKAVEQLILFPYSGITVPEPKMSKVGFRMVIVEKYLMFYKIFEDEKKIIFYRVLNGRTNYPTLMQRLYKDK